MLSLPPWLTDWIPATCFALAVVSAFVPWVNSEAIMLSFAAAAGSPRELVLLVLLVTSGHMAGKCVLYLLMSRTLRVRWLPSVESLERWRQKVGFGGRRALALIFVSAALGVPPFYLVTLAAGAFHIGFRGFAVAGTLGRLARFSALSAASGLAAGVMGA